MNRTSAQPNPCGKAARPRGLGRVFLVAVWALIAAGCSSGVGKPAPDEAVNSSVSQQEGLPPANDAGDSPLSSASQESEVPEDEFAGQSSDGKGQSGPGRAAGKGSRGLTPLDFPHEVEVPASALLTPTCVTRGDRITVEVETKPHAAVAYHAVYWGNEGGSEAPFGKGHGGNDKGEVSSEGRWESTWLVGPNAPIGKARVDVIVGWEGKWGYVHPNFRVAKSRSGCS